MRRAMLAVTAAVVLAGGTLGVTAPRTAGKHAPARAAVPSARNAGVQDAGPALGTAGRIQSLLRQAAALRAQNVSVTAAPTAAPRATRSRALHAEDAAAARADAPPGTQNDASGSADGSGATTTLVPGPVTDAVARLCGKVTICGVWWPGAVGDRGAYQSCMLHSTAAAAADLDFGSSPAEYCSSLYGGDCDDAVAGSDLGELCSLVPGVAAQWSPDYAFSRIVTSGDCAHYKTVQLPEKNVLGLRFDASSPEGKPAAGAAPQLRICTATLYLRLTQ